MQHVVAGLLSVHRPVRAAATLEIFLLDEHLVTLRHLDLLVFERQGDPLRRLGLLQELSLLRPVEVIVDVVAKGVLQPVHFSDHGVVLLSEEGK